MKFADILGHEDIKERIRSLVDSCHIPHALVIEGPSGSSKMMLARAMAQYIHCQNHQDGDSCGKCPACIQHQTFNHVDTIFSFPVVKKKDVTVSDDFIVEWRQFLTEYPFMDYEEWVSMLDKDNAKTVIFVHEGQALMQKLETTTHGSEYKVVIMWLPERMNEQCANRMLKLVEEPFHDTIFIMVSNSSQSILPTIYSRTQRIPVIRYSEEEVANYLIENQGTDLETARDVAHLSEGNINAALRLSKTSKDSKQYLELFMELMRMAYMRNVGKLKVWSNSIYDLGREGAMRFLEYCLRMIRENFILNLHIEELNRLTHAERDFSKNFSRFVNERNVEQIANELQSAIDDIAANASIKLVMFDLSIKMILLLKK